jgi:hypothetical protein
MVIQYFDEKFQVTLSFVTRAHVVKHAGETKQLSPGRAPHRSQSPVACKQPDRAAPPPSPVHHPAHPGDPHTRTPRAQQLRQQNHTGQALCNSQTRILHMDGRRRVSGIGYRLAYTRLLLPDRQLMPKQAHPKRRMSLLQETETPWLPTPAQLSENN